MEAFGAAASVAGILSLAVQGIQAINYLRQLYRECTDEAAQRFLHELSTSSSLLDEVQNLCLRLQQQKSGPGSQIRLATLQIQLEDCIQDLEEWLAAAKRIDARYVKLEARMTRASIRATPITPKRRFELLLHAVLKAKTMITTSTARQMVCERFQRHQRNVGTALAIIQTEFDLVHALRLEQVDARLEELSATSSAQDEKQAQRLSDLQSSGSSILALSRSNDGRLRDMQSLCSDLSDKLDKINAILSSHGSLSSRSERSQESFYPAPELPFEHDGQESFYPAPELPFEYDGQEVKEDIHSVDDSPLLSKSQEIVRFEELDITRHHEDGTDEEHDLKTLLEIYRDSELIFRQLFDPIIVEYFRTAQEWQAARARAALLQFVEAKSRAHHIMFDGSLSAVAPRCAARLLSLRRQLKIECSEENLANVDELFKFEAHDFQQWETMSKEVNEKGGVLVLPNETPSDVRVNEVLNRTNEWLLQHLYADANLRHLHESMLEGFLTKDQMHSYKFNNSEWWQRQVFKHWFLDDEPEKFSSAYNHANSASVESELTIIAFGTQEDGEDNSLQVAAALYRGIPLEKLSQTMYTPSDVDRVEQEVERMKDFWKDDEPPDGIAPAYRSRAIQALEAYRAEG